MSDQYLGEIRLVGFNFAPVGWAFCNGATLSISQNSALFSLIGTTYGGNGTTTFQLPNLQARLVICPDGSSYQWGQTGGSSSVTLTANNLPAHAHTVSPSASTSNATATSPAGAVPALVNDGSRQKNPYPAYAPASGANANLAATTTSIVGNSAPISTVPPYIAMYYIIAITGIFPTQS